MVTNVWWQQVGAVQWRLQELPENESCGVVVVCAVHPPPVAGGGGFPCPSSHNLLVLLLPHDHRAGQAEGAGEEEGVEREEVGPHGR